MAAVGFAPRSSILFLTAVLSVVFGGGARGGVELEEAFDWDGNLFDMPTPVYLHGPQGDVIITPAEYVRIAHLVGKPGPYQRLRVGNDTFRELGDLPGRKNFLEDLKAAVAAKRFGPEWKAFVKATSTARGAAHTTLITARAHSVETVYEGLRWLKAQGLIAHLPPKRNILVVWGPDYRPPIPSRPGDNRKMAGMRWRLAALARRRLPAGTQRVFRYSDDDPWQIGSTLKALSAERPDNVKVLLHFSNLAHSLGPPRTFVLRTRVPALRPPAGTRR